MHIHIHLHTNTASTVLTATSGESSRESPLWVDKEASRSAGVAFKSAGVASMSAKRVGLSDRACSTD